MVSGLWKNTKIYCDNNHTELTEMPLSTGGKLVYKCPHCNNSLSIKDFEKMLDHVSDTICDAEINGEFTNLTNYHWKNKNIFIIL